MDKQIRGLDITTMTVWMAFKSNGKWYSTGAKDGMLLLEHTSMEAVINYYLAQFPVPETVSIRTSWNTESYPDRVMVNRISQLVTEELKEPGD